MSSEFQSLEKGRTENSSHWKFRDRVFTFGAEPVVMGVLNVTPDSFSDGNQFFDVSRAVDRAFEMAGQGASIIDIGGESSRPGAEVVDAAEEIRRVVPVIERLTGRISAALSVDTTKADVADAALAAGAHIINDITACTADARMIAVAKKYAAGVVLMHMQGTPATMQCAPTYSDVVGEVGTYLRDRVVALVSAGIPRDFIAVDPGIGFGKTVEHNVALLANIPTLRSTVQRPLLIGVSRKSFLGKILGLPNPADRRAASLWAMEYAALRGAQIFRVHDVKESCDLARLLGTFRSAEHDV